MPRKKPQEKDNNERWLISYADFITLLFAFFVVMYAISSLNLEKYRAVSDSITKAFDKKQSTLNLVSVSEEVQERKVQVKPQTSPISNLDETNMQYMQQFHQSLSNSFNDFAKDGLVNVRSNKQWTEIEIKSNLLFESGSASPSEAALPLLKSLAKVLSKIDHSIVIEGYTDNIPIATEQYPSNWELSGARAAAVLRVFADNGVNPKYLSAVGFAEQHPIASNADDAGRIKNRRVLIVIAWNKQAQEFLDPVKRKQNMQEFNLSDDTVFSSSLGSSPRAGSR